MMDSLEQLLAEGRSVQLLPTEKGAVANLLGIRVREQSMKRPTPYMNEKQLFKAAKEIRLSVSERVQCKELILSVVTQPRAWWLVPLKRLSSATAALLIIVLIGGIGAVYASGTAMPGDMLYSMKINVSEPLQATFARTPEARAKFALLRAEARLHEAEMMAQSASMNDDMNAALTENFQERTRDLLRELQTLEETHQNTMAGTISMDAEASLRGHARVLERLAQSHHVQELLTEIHTARMHTEEVAIRSDMAVSDDAQGKTWFLAAASERAEKAINTASAKVVGKAVADPAVDVALARAKQAFEEIKNQAPENDDAMRLVRTALRSAREASVLADMKNLPAVATLAAVEEAVPAGKPAIMMMNAIEVPTTATMIRAPELVRDMPDDMSFSTDVRMRMTQKKLQDMDTTTDSVHESDRENFHDDMREAKDMLSDAEREKNEGNMQEAYKAADAALRRAQRGEKMMQKR